MIKFLGNEIKIPNNSYIFNSNRYTAYYEMMQLFHTLLKNQLVSVRAFNLASCKDMEKSKIKYRKEFYTELRRLKEYSNENEYLIDCLKHIYKILEGSGVSVEVNKSCGLQEDQNYYEIETTARIYVEEWNMAINPNTLNICNLMGLILNKDLRVLIIDYDYFEDRIIGFLLEREHEEINQIYKEWSEIKQRQLFEVNSKIERFLSETLRIPYL